MVSCSAIQAWLLLPKSSYAGTLSFVEIASSATWKANALQASKGERWPTLVSESDQVIAKCLGNKQHGAGSCLGSGPTWHKVPLSWTPSCGAKLLRAGVARTCAVMEDRGSVLPKSLYRTLGNHASPIFHDHHDLPATAPRPRGLGVQNRPCSNTRLAFTSFLDFKRKAVCRILCLGTAEGSPGCPASMEQSSMPSGSAPPC